LNKPTTTAHWNSQWQKTHKRKKFGIGLHLLEADHSIW